MKQQLNQIARALPRNMSAGLTGAVTVLPFALAFGANSPIGMAVSMLTVVAAGFLSSLIFQNRQGISMPTCVLFLLFATACTQLGTGAALTAALCAGGVVFLLSFLDLSKIARSVPMPMVYGFLLGAMVVMGVLQVNNYFGIGASGATTVETLVSYTHVGFHCNYRTMLFGTVVLVVMITYPRTFPRFSKKVPSPFIGIVTALLLNLILYPSAQTVPFQEIGTASASLLPDPGMLLDLPARHQIPLFLGFVASMVVLILAGAMTKTKDPQLLKQTLSEQGLSNLFLPCIGGMPITTEKRERPVPRYAGVFQSVFLLIFLLVAGKALLRLPISTLAVILIVTTFQQVDWAAVKQMFRERSKLPALLFLATACATVAFPLPVVLPVCGAAVLGTVAVRELKTRRASQLNTERSQSL